MTRLKRNRYYLLTYKTSVYTLRFIGITTDGLFHFKPRKSQDAVFFGPERLKEFNPCLTTIH